MDGTRGCWSFFTSVLQLKLFSKENGIEAAEQHLRDCDACNRRFEIRSGPVFKSIYDKSLPQVRMR